MRIHVIGENPTAKAVRGSLFRHDFHLTARDPDWTIHIEEPGGTTKPTLDGGGGELEQAILRHLRKQSAPGVEIQTGPRPMGGREMRIAAPAADTDRKAVASSVLQALLDLGEQALIAGLSKTRWWQRIFPA